MIIPYKLIQFFQAPKCEEESEDHHTITVGTHLIENMPTWYYRLNGNWFPDQGTYTIIDQGHMVYDQGAECYIAFPVDGKNNKRHFRELQWWHYRLIPFDEKKIVFIVVSRNACSCLLATAGKVKFPEKTKDFYPEPATPWGQVKHVSYDNCIEKFPGYTTAFVYSDPFFRWCNTCNYFEGVNFGQNGALYLPKYLNLKEFRKSKTPRMYSYLAHCEIESNYTYWWKDQHIMSQLETVGIFPKEIDLVVPIEKLSDFLRKEIGVEPVVANVEKSWWFNYEKDVPEDIKTRVMNLYEADYDIPELFAGKFYEG